MRRAYNLLDLHSRIWNTTTGQCLKTLAESHDAIWYVPLSPIFITFLD